MFHTHQSRPRHSYKPLLEQLEGREVPAAAPSPFTGSFVSAIVDSNAPFQVLASQDGWTISGKPSTIGTAVFIDGVSRGTFSKLKFTHADVIGSWKLGFLGTLRAPNGIVYLPTVTLKTVPYGTVDRAALTTLNLSFRRVFDAGALARTDVVVSGTALHQVVIGGRIRQLASSTDYTLIFRPPTVAQARPTADLQFTLFRGRDQFTLVGIADPRGFQRLPPSPLLAPRPNMIGQFHYGLVG